MNIKLNVKNILVTTALGGALVLTGCGGAKEPVGTVDVYSNNFNQESTYTLQDLIDNYEPLSKTKRDQLNNPSTNEEDYNYIVNNTIQEGDYYTIKDVSLVNTDKDQIITTIGVDTYVKVLGVNGNDYLVDYNGLIGYIPIDSVQTKQYVLYDDDSFEEYQPYTIRHMIRANTDVNMRTAMDTNSEIVGILYKDSAIEVLSHENGWYRFQYGDMQAFVKDDYCSEEFKVDGNILKLVYIVEPTELLYENSNESQRTLEFYESAEVLGDLDEYYLVNVDNVVGRVRKDACYEIEGKTVVVDLSSQTLKLYDDNEVLLYSRVVTGKDTTPTDKGLFPIYDKETEACLIGPEYNVDVNYWMPFNNGEGFNDATWRDNFGGDIYHTNGSDGCIDMSLQEAEVLYNNVEIGTKVLIHK